MQCTIHTFSDQLLGFLEKVNPRLHQNCMILCTRSCRRQPDKRIILDITHKFNKNKVKIGSNLRTLSKFDKPLIRALK